MRYRAIIVAVFLSVVLFSQENNSNIWYFGEYAGLDFRHGVPTALTDGQLNTWEGCASVCNQSGELLFYTDGQKVYNRNHQIMPNGNYLLGDYSASQSSIIVPKPSSVPGNNIYYIFTVDDWTDQFQDGLRYSVVDMSLEGGLGNVTSEKNILLHDKVAEKITAIRHSNNEDVWVLTHDWGSNQYLAYLVTEDSVSTTPVVTALGYNYVGNYNVGAGQLRFSKQGNYLVSTMNYLHRFELFKFNRSSGKLGDMLSFQNTNELRRAWGVEFSPNQRFLYVSKRPPEILLQFDLQDWDSTSVYNSKTVVASTSGTPDDYDAATLQMGPNGKIYLARYDKTYLSVINKPDEAGDACDFQENGADLGGRLCKWGLPNLFYYKGFQFFTGSEQEASICEGDSLFLENDWQTISGTYYDTLESYLGWDSIISTHLEILPSAPTPVITENNGVLISSSESGNQWYFNGDEIVGATNQMYQPFLDGDYQVRVAEEGSPCLSISEVYHFSSTDIKEPVTGNISIYPNPFNNTLFIKNIGVYSVKLYDLKGVLWYQKNNLKDTYKMQLPDLKQGMYILEISTKDRHTTRYLLNKLAR